MTTEEKKKRIEYLWDLYEEYKKTAEQHEFVKLLHFDLLLVPAHNDLEKNWDESHADTFIHGMEHTVLPQLGIKP